MQGTITFYDPIRRFFFITVKTPRGNGYSIEKFFSHMNRVIALECEEHEVGIGCPVTFEIAPQAVPPGRERIAMDVVIYPASAAGTNAKIAAAAALSGQNQKEQTGGAL